MKYRLFARNRMRSIGLLHPGNIPLPSVRGHGMASIACLVGVALIAAHPRLTSRAAILPDDVITQSGDAFAHGVRVNVVAHGAVRLGSERDIFPLRPGYTLFGSYTSVAATARHPFRVLALDATASVPADALLTAAVRTATPAGSWTPWRDLDSVSHAIVQGPTATRWQYRLMLSARNLADSPRVRQVTIRTTPLPPGYPTDPPPAAPGVSYQVFATREGLVGGVTANGHRIRPHDHFVALPSDTVLDCDGCRDYTVTITYKGRTTTQPVWDVGPWNTANPYWQRPSTPFRELPQGVAAARAAYQKGYQGGEDIFGRPVGNPAGIDLADGVFWDDLHMSGSDWVTVTYNWQGGAPALTRPYAAAWVQDRYQDEPARSITLTTDTRSDQITVWFKNLGTAKWDAHTVLAVYDPRHPTAPPAASAFCNGFGPDGQPDWASCAPGIPAFVGNGRPAGPGDIVPFQFYLKSPDTIGDTTLYLKLAQEANGRFQWISQPNGQDAFDAITIHVIPLPATAAASIEPTAGPQPSPAASPAAPATPTPLSATPAVTATMTVAP